jgi:hypothetical protein
VHTGGKGVQRVLECGGGDVSLTPPHASQKLDKYRLLISNTEYVSEMAGMLFMKLGRIPLLRHQGKESGGDVMVRRHRMQHKSSQRP